MKKPTGKTQKELDEIKSKYKAMGLDIDWDDNISQPAILGVKALKIMNEEAKAFAETPKLDFTNREERIG